eukprot:356602_1
MSTKLILKNVNKAPNGLTVDSLDCYDLLKNALSEVEAILSSECKNQISLHKHFFISQPFPLHGDREALTPLFELNDNKICNVTKILHATLTKFKFDPKILESTNIIVREYNAGEGIPFHIDHMDCKQNVFGIVILNKNQNQNGITYRKGHGKYTLNYTLQEECGTIFKMNGEARYKWKHGLTAVNGRRISITCRTYKDSVLKQFQLKQAQIIQQQMSYPNENKMNENSGNKKVSINLIMNNNNNLQRPCVISPTVNLKQLQKIIKNKFKIKKVKKIKFYNSNGIEIDNNYLLQTAENVYICFGNEPFSSFPKKPKTKKKKQIEQKDELILNIPKDSVLNCDLIQHSIKKWISYYYPKLRYYVIDHLLDASGKNDDLIMDRDIKSLSDLDAKICSSYLLVPEIRELIQQLQHLIINGLEWGFHSSLWDKKFVSNFPLTKSWNEGRMSNIYIIDNKFNYCLEFRVEGQLAMKGKRKGDGKLWKINNGFNNKNKNNYQRKRGIKYINDCVFFAGTVWLSSYYHCKFTIDNFEYTSVAQFVLSQQAKIFGDNERYNNLLKSSFDATPHKTYDHKAPKTGIRKCKNFDVNIWKQYGDKLMWKATLEKFKQNENLKHLLLETQNKIIVEATDDQVWGIGINIDHPNILNEKKWRGDNKMGQLLGKVRNCLRSNIYDEENKTETKPEKQIEISTNVVASTTNNTHLQIISELITHFT